VVTIDVASIVPSTRDFLQAMATRRKCLALVPLVERADDARAMADVGVAAVAVLGVGDQMLAISSSVGALPLISLGPVANDEDSLAARASGADAVVIEADDGPVAWDTVAKRARSTRMAVLAMATDASSAERVAKTAAKAVYLKIKATSELPAIMAKIGSMRILAHLPSADEATLRALRGVVDAAIVESDLYLSTSFESLREELDP
jgi:hypothetical protein